MNLGPNQMKDDLINLGMSEDKAQYFSEQVNSVYVCVTVSACILVYLRAYCTYACLHNCKFVSH